MPVFNDWNKPLYSHSFPLLALLLILLIYSLLFKLLSFGHHLHVGKQGYNYVQHLQLVCLPFALSQRLIKISRTNNNWIVGV